MNAHNDMQVLTGEGHDGCHWCDEPGAYEWWYVDVRDPLGEWGAVVILFRGMPMSPDYLASMHRGAPSPTEACGYSVSVYHHGKRVAMAFRGVDAERCSFGDQANVVVGPAHLNMQNGDLRLDVDTFDERVPQRVVLQLQLRLPWAGTSSDAPFQKKHGWVLAAPYLVGTMDVNMYQNSRRLVQQAVQVVGYHDHNMGHGPMQADFDDWHWGRVHVNDETFVFLDTTRFSWAGTIDQHGVTAWEDVRCSVRGRRPTIMGLLSPRLLAVGESRPGGKLCSVLHRRVLEDGPFYRRYSSTYTFDDGRTAEGYGEYMSVRRFGASWIRPFLRLPWLN